MGFCARFSDVIWREKQRWRLQMSTVFSSFLKLSSPEIACLFYLKTFANKQWKFMKEDYNFSRIWRDKKQFPHSLNVTILVKQKEIIGGWFYVKPSTCTKSDCAFDLYRISTESTFAIPYMWPPFLFFFFFAWKWIKTAFFRKALTSNQKKSC